MDGNVKYSDDSTRPGAQKAIAHGCTGFDLHGEVKDGYFYVHDTIDNGTSFKELTGSPPEYTPIPLSKLRTHFKIEYL